MVTTEPFISSMTVSGAQTVGVTLAGTPRDDLGGYVVAFYRVTSGKLTWIASKTLAAGTLLSWQGFTSTTNGSSFTPYAVALLNPAGTLLEYWQLQPLGTNTAATTGPAGAQGQLPVVLKSGVTITGGTDAAASAHLEGTGTPAQRGNFTWFQGPSANFTLDVPPEPFYVNPVGAFYTERLTGKKIDSGTGREPGTHYGEYGTDFRGQTRMLKPFDTSDPWQNYLIGETAVTRVPASIQCYIPSTTTEFNLDEAAQGPYGGQTLVCGVNETDQFGDPKPTYNYLAVQTPADPIDPPGDPDLPPVVVGDLGTRVARMLTGRTDDAELVQLANDAGAIILAMAFNYTRGNGFTAGVPDAVIMQVVVAATARLAANPEQLQTQVGSAIVRGQFDGWSPLETIVLGSYRKRNG